MFKDRNFSAGMIFMFVAGINMLATMALMPPFLQRLLGYPVLTTGYVLAPRGLGTMLSMFIVGRLVNRVDARLLLLLGLLISAYSIWQMSLFNTDVGLRVLDQDRRDPGHRHGLSVHAGQRARVLDPAAAIPHRGFRHLRAVAQLRQQHRRVDADGHARAIHADESRVAG